MAMQQVVLNRAAAELEQQQAAEAAAEQQAQAEAAAAQEEVDMQEADAEEVEGGKEEGEEQSVAAAAWVPRVVVLGRLHQSVSTAERAGQVVVVRPSHLAAAAGAAAAAQASAPAARAAPEVVVLPASARKAPAPSAVKRSRTPAPSAVKARTPAAAGTATKGATPAPSAALNGGARGQTPAAAVGAASAMKRVDGPELPKSMIKEAPGGQAVRLVGGELPLRYACRICWLHPWLLRKGWTSLHQPVARAV